MAGAREIVQDVQKELSCGICKEYCSQSVTMECGHSFCRVCLPSMWRARATAFVCPECRQVSQGRDLPVLSKQLAQETELGRQLSSQVLQSTKGQNHCAIHKEVFKLFCEDDQIPLCVRCSQSPEHRAHKLSPVEEAAHHYREKIQNIKGQLEKCFNEAKKCLAEKEKPVVDWHSMISAEYDKLNEFLMEEKSCCLERLKQEEGARQYSLFQHMQTLFNFSEELQQAGHQSNLDLLHNFKLLLGRSHSILSKKANPIFPYLRECPMPCMIDILSKFRVELRLDLVSASPLVTLSEDLKSVKAGEGWQEDPMHPEHSAFQFVFAEQSFSSGRQYWEVDVTQLPQWILGIHVPHVRRRRGRKLYHCDTKFLLQCVKKEEDYYLKSHPTSLKHLLKGPLPRVGIFLQHNPGTLMFYNVLQHSLIHRFRSIPFTEPVTPIFCPGPPLPGTKAGPMTLCSVDSHLCSCSYSFP